MERSARLRAGRPGGHCLYDVAVEVWTKRDPLKRMTTLGNGLKYVVFRSVSDFDEWLKPRL